MTQSLIKWVGGKTKLLPEILKRLPLTMDTYCEPFLGGGAVFFALMKEGRILRNAALNDANGDLVRYYDIVGGISEQFDMFLKNVDELRTTDGRSPAISSLYLDVRDWFNLYHHDPDYHQRPFVASHFLFLNKNCFNGVWRVNGKGQFNVPWGQFKEIKMPTKEELTSLRNVLRGSIPVYVNSVDFEEEMSRLRSGDVCYCDPPYLPVNATSFTKYSQTGFNLDDHQRLAKAFTGAAKRGARILLSNADTPTSRELYAGFKVETVQAPRSVNSSGTGRGKVSEILVSANL